MAHLHFFQTHKAQQKNAKEPPSQRAVTIDRHNTTERTPACNSLLSQLAVTYKIEAECYYQTFVQVYSEVLRNRHLRVAAKRMQLLFRRKIRLDLVTRIKKQKPSFII